MNESVFRKKSMERLKSPDSLNDYLQVTDPGIWLVLAAIIALLLGACVWGIFGNIESKIEADIQIREGIAECYVNAADAARIETGMVVRADDFEGELTEIGAQEGDSVVCQMDIEGDIGDGYYSAFVITESLKPVSLILN